MKWSWPLCCLGTAYLVGLSGLGGVVMYSEVISDQAVSNHFGATLTGWEGEFLTL